MKAMPNNLQTWIDKGLKVLSSIGSGVYIRWSWLDFYRKIKGVRLVSLRGLAKAGAVFTSQTGNLRYRNVYNFTSKLR